MEKKSLRISDAIPERPASFDEMVERTLERVCQENQKQEKETAPRSWTVENGKARKRKGDGIVKRIGIAAVAAVFVVCSVGIGALIALRSRSGRIPPIPAVEATQAATISHKTEITLLPDYVDPKTEEDYASYAALREQYGVPAYNDEEFAGLKSLKGEITYLDLQNGQLDYETVFSVPELVRGMWKNSPINGSDHLLSIENTDDAAFYFDDSNTQAEDVTESSGYQYFYSDVYTREDMDPWKLAIGLQYSFREAFLGQMNAHEKLTVKSTYRIYDNRYLDRSGDNYDEMVRKEKAALVGVIAQTVEIDLDALTKVDFEQDAELKLSGTYTLTAFEKQNDGSHDFSNKELSFEGVTLNEKVQYRATGIYVTLSVKELPNDWKDFYGTSLLYPSAWVAENMYGISAKLQVGEAGETIEGRVPQSCPDNTVVFVFPFGTDDYDRIREEGANLTLYLRAAGNQNEQEICRTALPKPGDSQIAIITQETPQPGSTEEPINSPMPTDDSGAATENPDRKTVNVSTVDEFLSAIAPNTEIVLASGTYDLSTAKDYGRDGDYFTWSEADNGYQLELRGLRNFRITGSSSTEINAEPRSAHVIYAYDCSGLVFSGFTAGHIIKPEACEGAVIVLESCTNTRIESCSLFGCGTLGISASFCNTVLVTGCDIYDCSEGAVVFENCSDVQITDTKLRECRGDLYNTTIQIIGCDSVNITNCDIYDNTEGTIFWIVNSTKVVLERLSVRGNGAVNIFDAQSPVTIVGCEFKDWSGVILPDDQIAYDLNGNRLTNTDLAAMKLDRTSGSQPAATPNPTATLNPTQKLSAVPSTFDFWEYDEANGYRTVPLEGVLFTCDFDGDGTAEEITYRIEESYLRILINNKTSYVQFDTSHTYADGLLEAILVDLDAESPTLNLVIVYYSSERCLDSIELHMENGKLVEGMHVENGGASLDAERNVLVMQEDTELLGTQEGTRTYSGDGMQPDSEWLTLVYGVTEQGLKTDREELIEHGKLLHLVRDLPCTIDGKTAVIPSNSYVYVLRYHESESMAEIRTEDGTITATISFNTAAFPLEIGGIPQDDYFDNIFYAD